MIRWRDLFFLFMESIPTAVLLLIVYRITTPQDKIRECADKLRHIRADIRRRCALPADLIRPMSAGVGDAGTWGRGAADPETSALGASETLIRPMSETSAPGASETLIRMEKEALGVGCRSILLALPGAIACTLVALPVLLFADGWSSLYPLGDIEFFGFRPRWYWIFMGLTLLWGLPLKKIMRIH